MKNLNDKVAIVTGASRGIGASIARALAAEGCHLALAARSVEALEAQADALADEFGIRTLVIPTDMADERAVAGMVQAADEYFNGVDILVNNAGLGIYGAVDEVAMTDLRHVFDVNFFGAVAAMQAVVPVMRRRGGGSIVNISSIVGKFPSPLGGGYTATKHALQGASGAARSELAKDNIDVILVCPGLTETEFSQNAMVSVPGVERKEGESLAPMSGISPDRVGRRTVQAIKNGEREVFITWFDRLLVLAYQLFPWPFHKGLEIYTFMRRARFAQLQAEKPSADGVPGDVAGETGREEKGTEKDSIENETEEEDTVIALTVGQLVGVLAAGAVGVGLYLWRRDN